MKSRAALRDALIAMVGEQPFATITVAALAGRAGVGYATFFRHYQDKHALLAEIADALIADLIERMVPSLAAGDGATAVRDLVARVAEQRDVCRALLTGAGDTMRRTITDRAVARSLAASAALPSWLPRELAVVHLVGATLTIVAWWLDHEKALQPDDLATILYRLVIAPAMPGAPGPLERS